MGNSEYALMAAESWDESASIENIAKSIKSIDSAISNVIDGETTFLINQKIIILKAVEQRSYKNINSLNLAEAIRNIRLYLECNKYVVTNEVFIESAYKLLSTLLEINYVENDEINVSEVLDFVEEGVEYLPEDLKEKVLSHRKGYISKYILNLKEHCESLKKGLTSLESLGKHAQQLSKTEIEHVKLELFKKFEAYDEVLNLIKGQFEKLYKNKSGKVYMDLCKDIITTSNSDEAKEKLKELFIRKNIPSYYLNKSFATSFNEKFILSYFHKSIEMNRFSQSDEAFKCIYKYYDYKAIKESYILKYFSYTKELERGENYIDELLKEKGLKLDLVVEKCNFIKNLKGEDESINIFVNYIYSLQKRRELNLLCAFISRFEEYYMSIREDDGWIDILLDLKGKHYILDYIIPMYCNSGQVNKNSLIENLIGISSVLDVKTTMDNFKVIDYYYNISDKEYINISKKLCEIKQYDEAITVLDLVKEYEVYKLDVQQQKLQICIAEGDGNRIVNVCEKIIEIKGGRPEISIINIYYRTLLKLKQYSKLTTKGQKHLGLYRSILSSKEKNRIDHYMARALWKSGNVINLDEKLYKFIPRTKFMNSLNKFGSRNLALASILIIIGMFIIQYVLFATGLIGPIKFDVEVNLGNDNFKVNEEIIIDPDIDVFPSYASKPKLRIESDDPSIIEVRGNKLVALKPGKSTIKMYDKNKIVYEVTKEVKEVNITDYKVDFEDEFSSIGDETKLKFIFPNENISEESLNISITSSNEKIVKVIDKNKVKALSKGKCTLKVNVNDIIKEINVSIKEKNKTSNDEFIFKDSSNRKLTENEVKNLDKSKLPYARNEIYARNGYIFSTNQFKDYFNKKSWYKGKTSDFGIEDLNDIERYNVNLIKKYESS